MQYKQELVDLKKEKENVSHKQIKNCNNKNAVAVFFCKNRVELKGTKSTSPIDNTVKRLYNNKIKRGFKSQNGG